MEPTPSPQSFPLYPSPAADLTRRRGLDLPRYPSVQTTQHGTAQSHRIFDRPDTPPSGGDSIQALQSPPPAHRWQQAHVQVQTLPPSSLPPPLLSSGASNSSWTQWPWWGCCSRRKPSRLAFPMVNSLESLGAWARLLAYRRAIHVAQMSTSMSLKLQFLELYNTLYSPRLITEESALQFLSHNLIYLYLSVGALVDMHIEQQLDPRWGHPDCSKITAFAPGSPPCFVPQTTYSRRYQIVARTEIDQKQGCLAMLLQPYAPGCVAEHRWIIGFRGTANKQDALNRRVGDGQGYLADLDPLGIGHTAFQRHARTLLTWLDMATRHGQRITLVGHSLGGVMALRMAAAVCDERPELSDKLDIFTYNAPGLDTLTLSRLQPHLAIRMFRTTFDWITKAGEGHPQGRVYITRGHPLRRIYNHSRAYLAEAEIMGTYLPITVQTDTDSGISGWIESFRRWLARWRPSRMLQRMAQGSGRLDSASCHPSHGAGEQHHFSQPCCPKPSHDAPDFH